MGFPLDSDRGFRRCCPFCKREFKVVLTEEEVNKGVQVVDAKETLPSQEKRFCPYCGQKASVDEWWTKAQRDFIIKDVSKHIMKATSDMFKSLERMNRPSSSVSFKSRNVRIEEPQISPETDDMQRFVCSCCGREIKIDEKLLDLNMFYCFFCGSQHSLDEKN